jgi:hypothetical protein
VSEAQVAESTIEWCREHDQERSRCYAASEYGCLDTQACRPCLALVVLQVEEDAS